MADNVMNVKLRTRYDTAANWVSNNPTLLSGELGIESDTLNMKVGDGSTVWNSLPYLLDGDVFQAAATILPNTSAAPALGTLAHLGEYRCRNYTGLTTAPTMTLPAIDTPGTDQFSAVVYYRAPNSTPPVVTNNSGRILKYYGTHVRSGTFTPVAGYDYQMSFVWTGNYLNCYVYGVII